MKQLKVGGYMTAEKFLKNWLQFSKYGIGSVNESWSIDEFHATIKTLFQNQNSITNVKVHQLSAKHN